MSDDDSKMISALLDDELDDAARDAALRKLARDGELKACWERQHRVRDALQQQFSPALDNGFAARVAAAIDNEPAILAPQPREAASAASVSRGYSRPLAGLAIAATVAVVSIAALQLLDSGRAPSVSPLAQQGGATINLSSSSAAQLVSSPGTHWVASSQSVRDRELEKRLNMYLSDHMEHATMGKVHGLLPYSRLVGYDTAE